MLQAHIIEQLKKWKEEKRLQTEQLPLEMPLPLPNNQAPEGEIQEQSHEDWERGVYVVELL